MPTDASLKRFGEVIQRVMRGENLSRAECYAAFREILLNEQPDLQQGAFLAALTAKGETPDEVAGPGRRSSNWIPPGWISRWTNR